MTERSGDGSGGADDTPDEESTPAGDTACPVRATEHPVDRRSVLAAMGVLPLAGPSGSQFGWPASPRFGRRVAFEDGDLARRGRTVALAGDTAVVGMPPGAAPDDPDAGAVAVLRRAAGTWTRRATLSPRGDRTQFGRSVSLTGDAAVVGAPLGAPATGRHAGAAVVFAREAGGWTRATTLSRGSGSAVDWFGDAVALDGATAVVGARTATTDRGFRTGAACVFTGHDGAWERRATLAPDRDGVEQFGRAVDVDADTVAVGARRHTRSAPGEAGLAYVFARDGDAWVRQGRLEPPSSNTHDGFGSAVAVDGDTAVVAAPRETNAAGTNAGAVYVYRRDGGRWRHRQVLRAADGGSDAQFGSTIALDGDALLVGTRADAAPLVFARVAGSWVERGTLAPAAGRPLDRPETAVELDGPRALVGLADTERRRGSITVFES